MNVPGRETAAAKARRLLVEGRLTVLGISPDAIDAVCMGDSGERHHVAWDPIRGWSCSCPSLRRCSHIIGLMLVAPPAVLAEVAS